MTASRATHRQDYQHARWHLNRALKPFLKADPMAGTAAVVGAVSGLDIAKRSGRDASSALTTVNVAGETVRIVDDLLSLQDWREARVREEEPLTAFVDFLRSCSPEAFHVAVTANAAVWSRLLGVATERPGVADDLLWPLASEPHFTALQGL